MAKINECTFGLQSNFLEQFVVFQLAPVLTQDAPPPKAETTFSIGAAPKQEMLWDQSNKLGNN